jgi:hypothetical protein
VDVLQLGCDDRTHIGAVGVQEREDNDSALQALEGNWLAELVGQVELRRGFGALEDGPVELVLGLPIAASAQGDQERDGYQER